MIKISPPLVFTLIYRGLPRGIVRMQPVAFPPLPGSSVLQELQALSEWLEPTEDYAAVREELTGESRELQGLEGAAPEVMQERLAHWKELYQSNGLGFLDESGNPVPCGSITIFSVNPSGEAGLEAPLAMVTALFGDTGE